MMWPLLSPVIYWWGNRPTRIKNFAPDDTANKWCGWGSCHFILEPVLFTPTLSCLTLSFPMSPDVYRDTLWSTTDIGSISCGNSISIFAEAWGPRWQGLCGPGWLNRERPDQLLRSASGVGGRAVVFMSHVWYLWTRWSYLRSFQEPPTSVPVFFSHHEQHKSSWPGAICRVVHIKESETELSIARALFNHSFPWLQGVLKTVRSYPT